MNLTIVPVNFISTSGLSPSVLTSFYTFRYLFKFPLSLDDFCQKMRVLDGDRIMATGEAVIFFA